MKFIDAQTARFEAGVCVCVCVCVKTPPVARSTIIEDQLNTSKAHGTANATHLMPAPKELIARGLAGAILSEPGGLGASEGATAPHADGARTCGVPRGRDPAPQMTPLTNSVGTIALRRTSLVADKAW